MNHINVFAAGTFLPGRKAEAGAWRDKAEILRKRMKQYLFDGTD